MFVGLDNYRAARRRPVFWQALGNNLWYALGTIPVSIALAIADGALGQRQDRRPRASCASPIFTPTMLPMIAVANIWLFFYTPDTACSSSCLGSFGVAEPQLARQPEHGARLPDGRDDLEGSRLLHDLLPRGAAVDARRTLGEAAAIEGASRWYFFRRVTFPLLMPTTLFVLVNAVINAFRLVDHIVVMTRGGPDNATRCCSTTSTRSASASGTRAYAAALTVVLLADPRRRSRSLQFLFLERRVHYQ